MCLAGGMAVREDTKPTFVITPHYAPLVEGRGYRWIPVGTNDDFLRVARRDPRVWSRMHGTRMVLAGMLTNPSGLSARHGDSRSAAILTSLSSPAWPSGAAPRWRRRPIDSTP